MDHTNTCRFPALKYGILCVVLETDLGPTPCVAVDSRDYCVPKCGTFPAQICAHLTRRFSNPPPMSPVFICLSLSSRRICCCNIIIHSFEIYRINIRFSPPPPPACHRGVCLCTQKRNINSDQMHCKRLSRQLVVRETGLERSSVL